MLSGENARATTHGKTRTGDRSGDGVQLCRDGTYPGRRVIHTMPSSPAHRAQAEATGLPRFSRTSNKTMNPTGAVPTRDLTGPDPRPVSHRRKSPRA